MHMAPLAPHWVLVVGETHVLPVPQQPLHTVPPQEHAPLEHESPPAQAAHARPPLPHVPELCIENATHWPLALQQPLAQLLGPQVVTESPCASEPPPVSVGTSFVTSGPGLVSWFIESPPPSATEASPAWPAGRSPRREVHPLACRARDTSATAIASGALRENLVIKPSVTSAFCR